MESPGFMVRGTPELGDLGWGFKSIGRGLKKVGKGAVKGAVKVGVKSITAPVAIAKRIPVAGQLVKLGEKLALLPLRYLIKAALGIGRTMCKAPPQLLELAATQANVDPAFIPLFCTAVRENKFSLGSLKRLLPPALKVASKMAAAGMFPPIVPALAVVKRLPYVGRFADADAGAVNTAVVRNGMRTLRMLALADRIGCLAPSDAAAVGLTRRDRVILQGALLGDIAKDDRNAMLLGGVTVVATALGFYLLFR